MPKITKTEDLPKATFAILQAAAAGTITFEEGRELAKLVNVHAEAMRESELTMRIAYLEEQQAR